MKIQKPLLLIAMISQLNATDITTLLSAIDKQPQTLLDDVAVKEADLQKRAVDDKLMPKLDGFLGYERYSHPSSLRPVLPSEMKNPNATLPFSKGIARAGANLSWPLFVKSLYTLKKKASLMHLAAKDMKKISLLQREASVIGMVAQLNYLYDLKRALRAKKRSILETKKRLTLMVKSGRVAENQLYILNAKVNDLDIQVLSLETSINALQAKLENLTNIQVRSKVSLRQVHQVNEGEIFALKPLNKKLEASKLDLKAAKESYYPSLALKGSYTYSDADAYNNDKDIDSGLAKGGIYLNIPLFDSSKQTNFDRAKLGYMKNRLKIEDSKRDLLIQAKELKREIAILKKSLKLSKKNIANQKRLLHIAKVSLENRVITQEEYLRYEDALAEARANLSQKKAQIWQETAKLAVIYGDDLKEIVR